MARKAQKKDRDYDDFLRGAADPLIAGPIHVDEGNMLAAYVYGHSSLSASCIGTRSNCHHLIEQERNDMIMQLMQRGANVIVCNSEWHLRREVKRHWPANLLVWIAEDIERKRAAEKGR